MTTSNRNAQLLRPSSILAAVSDFLIETTGNRSVPPAGPSEDTQPLTAVELPEEELPPCARRAPSAPGLTPARRVTALTPKPSRALGLRKVVAVVLDTERASQWEGDRDFRTALLENLSDEFPTADQVVLYAPGGLQLATFAPEDYLTSEATARYVRTDVELPPSPRPGGLPPITRAYPIPGAIRK